MTRVLYRLLVALHPRGFRARFADEMVLTFEDALATEGSARLLFDALRSLMRQWLWRQSLWLYPVALIGATGVMSLVSWTQTAVIARTPAPKSSGALLLLIAVMAVMAVLFTTIFCVVWLRMIQRMRRART